MLDVLGDGPFRLMFDIKEMKPGCALLQAAVGSAHIASAFDPAVWLVVPTPDMKVYEITKDQLGILVARVHERHLGKEKKVEG